jgi:hypothetical protein
MAWKEICWNIVNSLLAGALVFLGGMVATNGSINGALICAATITAGIAAVTKFAEYWKNEEKEYADKQAGQSKLFAFI